MKSNLIMDVSLRRAGYISVQFVYLKIAATSVDAKNIVSDKACIVSQRLYLVLLPSNELIKSRFLLL